MANNGNGKLKISTTSTVIHTQTRQIPIYHGWLYVNTIPCAPRKRTNHGLNSSTELQTMVIISLVIDTSLQHSKFRTACIRMCAAIS